MFVHFNENLII